MVQTAEHFELIGCENGGKKKDDQKRTFYFERPVGYSGTSKVECAESGTK